MWYSGYSDPIPAVKKEKPEPKHYVCILTPEGYDYIEFLNKYNSSIHFDDHLCTNRETNKFGRIYKWVPDENNLVERQMSDYKKLYADELKQISISKKPKIKTKKQLQALYKRKLRNTIRKSVKEAKNDLHRQK